MDIRTVNGARLRNSTTSTVQVSPTTELNVVNSHNSEGSECVGVWSAEGIWEIVVCGDEKGWKKGLGLKLGAHTKRRGCASDCEEPIDPYPIQSVGKDLALPIPGIGATACVEKVGLEMGVRCRLGRA
ncbi:unnamed protein product [Bursaphelenchus okinawaensis]|uniref:Uncharacterized protein n=1 Tax=Bursaphelenchus okinawaensis TaxID=465554 RepID=A0A811LG69_9BILA|nr:unnamed protein product [Bursaphelenchus okinawaensis]CAG9124576.1 unnamed protein product [Bursaphelenchus okinawaensis]